MTSTTDIKFECDGCGQRLIVDESAAGADLACPICARELQVPHHSGFDSRTLLGERNGAHVHSREELAERDEEEEEEEFEGADSPAEAHLLRRQLADANLLNERLERELEAAQAKLAQGKEQSAERERAAGEKLTQATRRESEFADRQNRVSALNAGLEREIAALTAKLALAEEEASRRESELVESHHGLEHQVAGLKGKLAEARQAAARQAEELLDIQGRLQAREQELATVSKGREKFEARVTELREELKLSQDERELSRQLATGLAAQLASREGELAQALATVANVNGQLRAAEGRLALLEQEAAARQLELLALRQTAERKVTLEKEFAEAQERLAETQSAREALAKTCEGLQRETDSLKRQLNDSAAGREVLSLREQLATAEGEAQRRERLAQAAEAEARKWREAEERSQEGLKLLRARCEKAERHFEEGAEAALARDCAVLRGIVERQKAELAQQHSEVLRSRRAQVALRLAYAVVAIVSVAAVGVIAHLLWRVL